jgi:ribosomal protein L4
MTPRTHRYQRSDSLEHRRANVGTRKKPCKQGISRTSRARPRIPRALLVGARRALAALDHRSRHEAGGAADRNGVETA